MPPDKDDWNDSAQSFESSLMILRKDKNGWVIGFSVHPSDVPHDLLNAPLGTRFQTVLFEIGDDEQPVPTEENAPSNYIDFQEARKVHDPVARAGQLCRDPVFQGWILSSTIYADGNQPDYQPKEMEELAAAQLRHMLGVISRSDIRKNPESKRRFSEMQEQYRAFQIEEDLEFPFTIE